MTPAVRAQVIAHTLDVLAKAPKEWGRMIDVSMYNRTIVWKKLAAEAGLCAVAIKISEGAGIVDGRAHDNWQGAGAVGLRRAPYLFDRPSDDVVGQVDLFERTLKAAGGLKPQDLRPIIDLERATPELKAPQDNQRLQSLINALHDRFGVLPILYTSKRYCLAEGITVGGECALHDVDYVHGASQLLLPAQWSDWDLAQVGFAPGVPGIEGDVDRDLVKTAIEKLSMGGV